MQNKTVIGFIGAGNMGYALIKGLINSGYPSENIKACDANEDLLQKRSKEFGINTYIDNAELLKACDVVVLAVKPQVLTKVCTGLRDSIKPNHLVISIVAGIRANDINRWLGGEFALVRSMPNTPALMQQGITGMFANKLVSDEQKSIVSTILSTVGQCFWVKEEKLIDAITAISGSGPAYFFLLMQSMTQAAIALGLDKETASALSVQTAYGASTMAVESGEDPQTLRQNVTSPNGTTQAAIELFQDQNFEGIVAAAIRAAYDRAHEISIELGDKE
jgi:pyrroline-5-carboxylate reductase